jgi:hypothetical protein
MGFRNARRGGVVMGIVVGMDAWARRIINWCGGGGVPRVMFRRRL